MIVIPFAPGGTGSGGSSTSMARGGKFGWSPPPVPGPLAEPAPVPAPAPSPPPVPGPAPVVPSAALPVTGNVDAGSGSSFNGSSAGGGSLTISGGLKTKAGFGVDG